MCNSALKVWTLLSPNEADFENNLKSSPGLANQINHATVQRSQTMKSAVPNKEQFSENAHDRLQTTKVNTTASWTNIEHGKFTTWEFHELEVPGLFATCNVCDLRIYIFRGWCQVCCFAWWLFERLWYKVWSFESSFIHSRQKAIDPLLWDVLNKSMIHLQCSHSQHFMPSDCIPTFSVH